jgi:hypothetical protein
MARESKSDVRAKGSRKAETGGLRARFAVAARMLSDRSASRAVLGALVGVGVLWAGGSWTFARELEGRRDALLARTSTEARALTDAQARFLPSAERAIVDAGSRTYAGDLVAPELANEGALDELLARRWVYFRGVAEEVRRPEEAGRAAWASWKDGFVLCAMQPPATRDPLEQKRTAQRYYLRGALFEDATSHVSRFDTVSRALSVLSDRWSGEVRAADNALWLHRLELEERERDARDVERAKVGAESGLLVVVMDELLPSQKVPEAGPGLTDHQRESLLPALEEEAHWARVEIHDLHAGRPLLRMRRFLDAKKLGLVDGKLYTASLQGCELAMEMRASVDGAKTAAR